MAKKTALEWFAERLKQINGEDNPWFDIPLSLLEKAKTMEKEQIVEAFTKGELIRDDYFDNSQAFDATGQNYYRKTYNNGL
jgi:hypothetical protein